MKLPGEMKEERTVNRNGVFFRGVITVMVLIFACLHTSPVMAKSEGVVRTTVSVKKNKTYSKTMDLNEKLTIVVKNGDKKLFPKSVIFRSSKKEVATVSKKGVVTPKAEGKTVISIRYGKKTVKLKLTVTADDLSDSGIPGVTSDQDDMSTAAVTGQDIVDYALSWVGVTPYVWAGNSLTGGTDAPGFVHLVYEHYGIDVPKDAYDMSSAGYEVPYSEAEPGDIIVYNGSAAIYIGDGAIIICSDEALGTVIRYDATYRIILACRRII